MGHWRVASLPPGPIWQKPRGYLTPSSTCYSIARPAGSAPPAFSPSLMQRRESRPATTTSPLQEVGRAGCRDVLRGGCSQSNGLVCITAGLAKLPAVCQRSTHANFLLELCPCRCGEHEPRAAQVGGQREPQGGSTLRWALLHYAGSCYLAAPLRCCTTALCRAALCCSNPGILIWRHRLCALPPAAGGERGRQGLPDAHGCVWMMESRPPSMLPTARKAAS